MTAVDFVFNTLNANGSSYSSINDMMDGLSASSDVSFTGHSLGGALAQYMTYRTADIMNGDTGTKSPFQISQNNYLALANSVASAILSYR